MLFALWLTTRESCVKDFHSTIVKLSFLLRLHREDVERRFEGKLSKNMSGSLYEMVSRVMKSLVNRKITVPGNFQGSAPDGRIQNTLSSPFK